MRMQTETREFSRFMKVVLLTIIKMSKRVKLSSAYKICNCKPTVLQWNVPLQDAKRRKNGCCTCVVEPTPALQGLHLFLQPPEINMPLFEGLEIAQTLLGDKGKLLLWVGWKNMVKMPASCFLSSISWTAAHYQKSFASPNPTVPLQLSCEVVSSANTT